MEVLICFPIDPIPDQFKDWPLHCTVMPWFVAIDPADSVRRELRAIAQQHRAVELRAGNTAWFTESRSSVRLLQRNTRLMRLHQALYGLVKQYGNRCCFPQYVGDCYTPHVTDQATSQLPSNYRKVATELVVVIRDKDTKLVFDRIMLSS